MKKTLLLTLTFLSGIAASLAQSNWTEEEKNAMQEKFQTYKEQLALTENQQHQVNTIMENYWQGLSGLSGSSAGKFQKYRSWKSLQSTRDREMKKVLSPSQYSLFQQFQQELRTEAKKKRQTDIP